MWLRPKPIASQGPPRPNTVAPLPDTPPALPCLALMQPHWSPVFSPIMSCMYCVRAIALAFSSPRSLFKGHLIREFFPDHLYKSSPIAFPFLFFIYLCTYLPLFFSFSLSFFYSLLLSFFIFMVLSSTWHTLFALFTNCLMAHKSHSVNICSIFKSKSMTSATTR